MDWREATLRARYHAAWGKDKPLTRGRRDYVCGICRRPIAAGVPHVAEPVWDTRGQTYRAHERCDMLWALVGYQFYYDVGRCSAATWQTILAGAGFGRDGEADRTGGTTYEPYHEDPEGSRLRGKEA